MTENRNILTIESLTELASVQQPPCLSLYQPTHRRHPENQQDPIRFRNLVKELEKSLRRDYPAVDSRLLLEPFEKLAHETDFWNHTLDGLAVLGGPDLFRVFRLQRPIAEFAVVSDTFHTKPLRRFLQSVGRFQVLGLSLGKVQLFEGNRDVLDEIAPAPGVPLKMTDVLGDEAVESHMSVASYGGTGQGSSPMHHGDGGKQDGAKAQAERFFRAVDRAVLEHHSQPSGLPLILAALPEHHHLFRHVSHNPFLLAEGISVNPDAVTIDELRNRAWQVVEPQYLSGLATLADNFAGSKAKGLGSDDLAQVGIAAAAGRVATLLIESDRHIAGRLESSTGRIDFADPQGDDLLDDLGELVGKSGGRVMVLPADRMPVRTGLAASYRY
jgi:Bacterial archaeo-eukaryotic release factor family 3